MSWQYTLQDASFNGVKFDCLHTQDSVQRDIASHEYPYLDGADVEDLGRKARQVSMTAVFFGYNYENRLQLFLTKLNQAGPGELIHPVFGSIKAAQLQDYRIAHDAESPDYCTVEMSFIEVGDTATFFDLKLPLQLADILSALSGLGLDEAINSFAQAIGELRIGERLNKIQQFSTLLFGTIDAVRRQVGEIVGTTLNFIDNPRAFAGDMTSMVFRLVDDYQVAQSQSRWQDLKGQFDQIITLPSSIAAEQAQNSASVLTSVDVKVVTGLLQAMTASAMAEAASRVLSAEAETPTLSPPQIEQMTNDVRQMLQAAMDTQRELFDLETARPVTEALKDTALAVQQAAEAIINLRPPLESKRAELTGNLHLLAHQWYGDFSRAAELVRLNPQLRNPNQITVGDVLYAYAK